MAPPLSKVGRSDYALRATTTHIDNFGLIELPNSALSPEFDNESLPDDVLLAAEMTQTIAGANAAQRIPPQVAIASQLTAPMATLDGVYALMLQMSRTLRDVQEKVEGLSTTLETTVRDREYMSRTIMLRSTRDSQTVPNGSTVPTSSNNVTEKGKKAPRTRKKQGAFRDYQPGTIIPAIRIRLHENDKEIAKAMNGVAFTAKRTALGLKDPYHDIRSVFNWRNNHRFVLRAVPACKRGLPNTSEPKIPSQLVLQHFAN
jgi:hypothetical protein